MLRRHFLHGAGGFTLALPLLESLQPRSARADPTGVPPRFVAMCTEHGGIWSDHMHPSQSTLTDSLSYAGQQVRSGSLVRNIDGDIAHLSPVLRAPASLLTQDVVGKLNVLRGLDIPFYIGHHHGGHLGNFGANDGNGDDGVTVQAHLRPTIDQHLAWSPSFYTDLSSVLERSIVHGRNVSWGWSSPGTQSGGIQALPGYESSLGWFNRIFVPDDTDDVVRPPVVDRVVESWQSLREGNRRLSTADRRRVDDHMDRLHELARRLEVIVSCDDVASPTEDSAGLLGGSFEFNPDTQRRYWQLFNDVVAAAFACGTCRVAVFRVEQTFSTHQGDWHQDIAHQANLPGGHAQQIIAEAHQRTFEDVFLDLVHKLDIEEVGGTTMLDNTLVAWTQESGLITHESLDMPVVTAGSASGLLRTGLHCDYRNMAMSHIDPPPGFHEPLVPGLMFSQYLGTVMQSMGIPPSEYETNGVGGYGHHFVGPNYGARYPNSAVFDVMGEPLPFLT
jgi:hypothetical protein